MTGAELHQHALEAHRVGNRGRLALAQALRIFKESGEYKNLGFSTLIAYADKTFGFRKSETYALVKVAVALDQLPRCLDAFAAGRLCRTALRAILSEELLAAESGHADGVDAPEPVRYALIYQACPHCERAGVHTTEGLVEVDREEIERVAGEADVEVVGGRRTRAGAGPANSVGRDRGDAGPVDRPTPSSLQRKMLLRDGTVRGNPCCPNPADHVHHIVVFRSDGGATRAENLVTVCATCHALIHAGLLTVSGRSGDLRWQARADQLMRKGLRKEGLVADSLPAFRIDSTAVENGSEEAATRVRRAAKQLQGGSCTLEDRIRTALSAGCRVLPGHDAALE